MLISDFESNPPMKKLIPLDLLFGLSRNGCGQTTASKRTDRKYKALSSHNESPCCNHHRNFPTSGHSNIIYIVTTQDIAKLLAYLICSTSWLSKNYSSKWTWLVWIFTICYICLLIENGWSSYSRTIIPVNLLAQQRRFHSILLKAINWCHTASDYTWDTFILSWFTSGRELIPSHLVHPVPFGIQIGVGTLSKSWRQRKRECGKTKDLMGKTTTPYVHFETLS